MSQPPQAHGLARSPDDMRGLDVRGARRRVSRGMVVRQRDAARVAPQGRRHDLSEGDGARSEAAGRERSHGEHVVPLVGQDQHDALRALPAQPGRRHPSDVAGGPQLDALALPSRARSVGEGEGGHKPCRLGRAEARDADQVLEGRSAQATDAVELVEEGLCQSEDVLPRPPGTEVDGDELGVGQGAGTHGHESLSGAVAVHALTVARTMSVQQPVSSGLWKTLLLMLRTAGPQVRRGVIPIAGRGVSPSPRIACPCAGHPSRCARGEP